ncbi:MAG: hypothetical protein K5866_09385 [Treponema sp.]|nr:hypothetical protein [Treponema sp.]
MKKSLILVLCLALTTSFIFAQADEEDPFGIEKFEAEKTKTYRIVPEEQHCVDINAKVYIEYNPTYDEARIYYETLYVTYAKDEAMNTVMAVLQDFTKEHQYYHYKYLKDDREKYFKDDRGQRKAQYSSYVKFSR